jgi:hypothetical protein
VDDGDDPGDETLNPDRRAHPRYLRLGRRNFRDWGP